MRLQWALGAALLAGLALARRPDMDFEFEDADAADMSENALTLSNARRPRRFIYDPRNPLCQALVCARREVCLLRERAPSAALCAARRDVLRRGDEIVSAGAGGGGGGAPDADADDVFYEAPAADPGPGAAPDRCVGCGGWSGGGGFLCGSDNRTYSSLCRLDLHNCVRRPAPPVALACRGFCPCRPPRRARPNEWRRRKAEAHDEVPPRDPAPAAAPPGRRLTQGGGGGTDGCALDKMADRLLDWFSVLMEEAGAEPARRARRPRRGRAPRREERAFPADCKAEVRWMFAHLDADGDGALSARDLYALRHDERERCLRPFLASCGGGGGGGGVSRGAWCACLGRAARPCRALARAHGGAAAAAGGGYVPACDARGYYRARQCHAAVGVCWCVDAHGAERPGSRTKGEPACPPARAPRPAAAAPLPPDDEDALDGSGDAELRY